MGEEHIHDLRTEIANILNIADVSAWEIVDSDEENNLYMIHYTDLADLDTWGYYRGIVVDIKNKMICSQGLGYIHSTVVDDSTDLMRDGHNIHIPINGEPDRIFKKEEVVFTYKIEGLIFKIFKYNGTVYFSSYKSLDIRKSRYGSSPIFEEMYRAVDGPTNEQLFDPTKDFSPYSHNFILSNPYLFTATKLDLKTRSDGFLTYLGASNNNWEIGQFSDISTDSIELEAKIIETSSNIEEVVSTIGVIYNPPVINYEEAIEHLRKGWYPKIYQESVDSRLNLGESIMAYLTNPVSNIYIYEIRSFSYDWRSTIVGNFQNLKYRFYSRIDDANIKSSTDFELKYPIFPKLETAEIISMVEVSNLLYFPAGVSLDIYNYRDKLYNIWISFLMSVPLCRQLEVVSFYQNIVEQRKNLINWYGQINEDYEILPSELSARATGIILKTREKLREKYQIERGNKKKLFLKLLKTKIMSIPGTILYRLVREMEEI